LGGVGGGGGGGGGRSQEQGKSMDSCIWWYVVQKKFAFAVPLFLFSSFPCENSLRFLLVKAM